MLGEESGEPLFETGYAEDMSAFGETAQISLLLCD